MSLKQVAFFTILVVIIAIPTVYAQEISIGEKAQQKSVQVVINSSNEIHVKHVIAPLNSPKQIDLIDGVRTNITVLDNEGDEKQFSVVGDNESILIFPSKETTIVEYDLGNVIFLKNNMLTWDFIYLETTSFIIPEEIDLIFVNNRPVYMGEKKGITCHGCQMMLEYFIDVPKILKNVSLDNKKYLIEIRTFADINQFNFNQTANNINFEVRGEKQFVTTIIPAELLSRPYSVLIGDKKIAFSEYINNGTHIWLNMRPDNSGTVSIIGSTIIGDKINTQDNFSIENQEGIVYIVLGIIILSGFFIMITMKKRKLSRTKLNPEGNTQS